jgi:hypothetical protein
MPPERFSPTLECGRGRLEDHDILSHHNVKSRVDGSCNSWSSAGSNSGQATECRARTETNPETEGEIPQAQMGAPAFITVGAGIRLHAEKYNPTPKSRTHPH